MRAHGYETIMVNCNPETVSTDYDTSDKLYFEPLTLEDVLNIYEREQCAGVIVQFGGQTPLNLAKGLQAAGATIIGTSPEDIDAAEDRDFFKQLADRLKITQPPSGIARNTDEAVAIAECIGYPCWCGRPLCSGGRAMVIVYNEKYLRRYMAEAEFGLRGRPILVDHFSGRTPLSWTWTAFRMARRRCWGRSWSTSSLAGIHSGDSACSIPPRSLSPGDHRAGAAALPRSGAGLHVRGLINIQYAVQDGEVYILRSQSAGVADGAFRSKSIGVPLAKLASLCMVGKKLKDLRFHQRSADSLYDLQGSRISLREIPRRGHRVVAGDEVHWRGDGH